MIDTFDNVGSEAFKVLPKGQFFPNLVTLVLVLCLHPQGIY